MSINSIGSDPIRPNGPKPAREQEAERPGGHDSSGAERTRAGDRIEISAEGRSLAAQFADLDDFRVRIKDGTYNKPAVMDKVARRILASGALS